MKIRLSATARRHLALRKGWWDSTFPNARVRVQGAYKKALKLITERPHIGRRYEKDQRYRMWPLQGTYFYVLYRVDEEAGVIRISAVWSTKFGEEPPLE